MNGKLKYMLMAITLGTLLPGSVFATSPLVPIVEIYEQIHNKCQSGETKDVHRCSDVLFTLGYLYYEETKDALEDFDERMKEYEQRTGSGYRLKPVRPNVDYSKSLNMYRQLVHNYPGFRKLPDALIQMGSIYKMTGQPDSARIMYEQVIQRFPSTRPHKVSYAHFYLAELELADGNRDEAYNHLKKVWRDDVSPDMWKTVQSRLAELEKSR